MHPQPNNFCSSKLQAFPSHPGVYLMKNAQGTILYIGKAINLKKRIKSYFVPGRDGRMMVPFLTSQVTSIDVIVVASEKEALLLENTLIKQHHPKYNVLLKDDKTFLSLMLNIKHPWPMLKVVRLKGRPPQGNLYFGPYPNAMAARHTLELLRQLFPLRQCSDHELSNRTRPCILYDLKRCIAPCCHQCTPEDYALLVQQVRTFLKGETRPILQELQQQLHLASEHLQFEKAQYLHTLIQAVEKTLETQAVHVTSLEDTDVLALARQADRVVVTLQSYREGRLTHSQHRHFTHVVQEDQELFESFLLQHYRDQPAPVYPILLSHVLDSAPLLSDMLGRNIHTPQKGEKKKIVELALLNAEIALKQAPEEKIEPILLSLEERLNLTHYPERIECVDQSHLSGHEPVGAIVTMIDGIPSKQDYRKYKLSSNDDYHGLQEVLQRRFRQPDVLPDLLLIDGGKGHLNLALEVLSVLNISTVDVVAIAKEEGRHDRGTTQEKLFVPHHSEPIVLPLHSQELFFLQKIRDEAHRYVLGFQKSRRKTRLFQSELDQIPGIGPIKKKRLLTHFGSVKQIKEAVPEAWKAVKGITTKDIECLQQWKERSS